MTRAQPSAPRRGANWAAFVLGLPLAAALLGVIHYGPLHDTVVERYVAHPVEYVEVLMFCGALGVLLAKLMQAWGEGRACRAAGLPPWNGQAVPASDASRLLADLGRLPRRLRDSLLGRRVTAVLHFVTARGSAAELDDQMRALADTDALALEGSYALTRFITWAIPILGFLGTVLGITKSIAGVTPEKLENNLSEVTDGLALAFDATALALGLTMLTMFLSFVVERSEQAVLDAVDQTTERELAHRFERLPAQGGAVLDMVRGQTTVLLEGMEQLVRRQAELWARSLAAADERRAEAERRQEAQLTTALEGALERTLREHARRLQAVEERTTEQSRGILGHLAELAGTVRETQREQQAGLARVADGVAAQVEALARLREGEHDLRRLQETLNQNLAALAEAGNFEQAIHSLTAAIHLLTARAATPTLATPLGPRPGKAA